MHFNRVRMLHLPYYLYRSIEKMSYTVKKRDYPQQMQSIFHHSLIKMVVMHQLQQKGIPWETFIANYVFTSPQAQQQQDVPSSSHPPIPPSTHIPSYIWGKGASAKSILGEQTLKINIPPTKRTHMACHLSNEKV